MSVESLISRLDGVRRTGPDRWLAKCPAHDDRKASLGIRALDDGMILLYCFAGCEVEDILHSAGLTFSDLYPQRLPGKAKLLRHPFPAADVLVALEFEAFLVAGAAARIARGDVLEEPERERLLIAAGRISAAVQYSGHGVRYAA